MAEQVVVFGGSGFIGRALCRQLLQKGYHITVVCQNIARAQQQLGNHANLVIKTIDLFTPDILQKTVKNAPFVINLIGKLYEEKPGEFDRFHRLFPQYLAQAVTDSSHLIHLSALGIEAAASDALYAKTKLAGEQAITEQVQQYTILRPSVVFGPGDQFFNRFASMSQFSPFLPLVGDGSTLFSPVYVEDVVRSILAIMAQKPSNMIYAAVGPDTDSFKTLMAFMLKTLGRKRIFMPIPRTIAHYQASVMNLMKIYLLTPDQVALLQHDNVNRNKLPNINTLIGACASYRDIVPQYIQS